MIVVMALAPITFKLICFGMVRFSVYVAAATIMESPDTAREIACPIVLHAVSAAKQLLVSLPSTPSTYQVLLAKVDGARVRNNEVSRRLVRIRFMTFLLGEIGLRCNEGATQKR